MISNKLIENLMNSGISSDFIEKIIECDYLAQEETLKNEMLDALDFLKNQVSIRKIAKSL
jgi:hypothetical protein